jgi:hypothetical protein
MSGPTEANRIFSEIFCSLFESRTGRKNEAGEIETGRKNGRPRGYITDYQPRACQWARKFCMPTDTVT